MAKRKRRKKKPKLVRAMSRFFFKTNYGVLWTLTGVYLLATAFFAWLLRSGQLLVLFGGMFVAITLVIVLADKLRSRRKVRGSNDSDAEPYRPTEIRLPPTREREPDPVTYGSITNLPNHFN